MDRDAQLIYEAYLAEGLGSTLTKAAGDTSKKAEEVDIDREGSDKWNKWDTIQTGLDIAGISPEVVGTSADAANVAISVTRGLGAALRGERDEIKRHAINAAISSISMIPFADVVKLLKLRKLARTGKAGKEVAKGAIQGMRTVKTLAKGKKAAAAARATRALGKGHGEDEDPVPGEGPIIDVPGTVEPAPEDDRGITSPDHFRQRFARKVAA